MQLKRVFCGILSAAMLITAFAGCQNQGGESQQSSSEGQNEKPYEGQTVNFVVPGGRGSDWTQEHLDEFQEKTGIIMNIEQLTNEQIPQKIAVSMSAGGKDIDILVFAPLQNKLMYVNNGWLEPLTDYVANSPELDIEDFIQSTRDACSLDGVLYGLPVMTEREVVAYNTKMFEEAGITEIPTTFEELEAAAAACTKDDVAGITIRGKGAQAVTQFSGFLYGFGGDWMDENGNATINSPEAIEAFDYYGRLLREYGPMGSINMDWQETANVYAQGLAAMRVDCDSQYAYLTDPDSSLVAEDTSVFMLPGGSAGAKPFNIVAWAMGISTGSEHKEAAWEFIKWYTSKESDVEMLKVGNPSCRTSSWENEEAASVSFREDLVKVINETNQVGVGYDRPVMINVGEARTEIGNVIVTAIEGGDIQAAADKANAAMQELLDEENAG